MHATDKNVANKINTVPPKKEISERFVDCITGLCGVDVEGTRNYWNVVLRVAYRKGQNEFFTECPVRCHLLSLGGANIPDRETARQIRDAVLVFMNSGKSVFIQTAYGIEEIRTSDFDWHGPTPARFKIRGQRKKSMEETS